MRSLIELTDQLSVYLQNLIKHLFSEQEHFDVEADVDILEDIGDFYQEIERLPERLHINCFSSRLGWHMCAYHAGNSRSDRNLYSAYLQSIGHDRAPEYIEKEKELIQELTKTCMDLSHMYQTLQYANSEESQDWQNISELISDVGRCITTLSSRELYVYQTSYSAMKYEYDQVYILYAPLADVAFLVTRFQLIGLALAALKPEYANSELVAMLDELVNVLPVPQRNNYIRTEKDFINLSILPNNICNFSCTYCYSAKGRSIQQLTFEQAKLAIDYFLSPQRNDSKLLTVSIFGGGEPLLSWKSVVLPSIEYIIENAVQQDRRIMITLITNGSVIPENFVDICRKYGIDLVCSFEILEDVQNSQRKHFDIVAANIRKLIDNKIVPAINSVITNLNVDRLTEMVETLHSRYPEIRYAAFEPVIEQTDAGRAQFYKKFAKGFLKALKLAEAYNINLTCSTLRNVDVTVDRYCPGELALCADGSLSVCPCVSSPQEPNFERFVYGKIDDRVEIDQSKLSELLALNVHSNLWCKNCFAKYNCGGGCMNGRLNNGNEQDSEYCHFTQSFLKYIITKRLDEAYKEDYGISITKKIGSYECFIEE